jgi:hypothetical protein
MIYPINYLGAIMRAISVVPAGIIVGLNPPSYLTKIGIRFKY